MLSRKIWIAMFAFALLGAAPVWAKSKWHNLGDYQTGGEAKEIVVNREISQCAIEAKEGDVIINTLVVREGGKKTPITLAIRLAKGQPSHIVQLGEKRMVTGFRISDGARGVYRISVK